MSIATQAPPDGYQELDVLDTWQIGHLFFWSEVFDGWLREQFIFTVRPNETVGEAYYRETGNSLSPYQYVFEPAE